MTIYNIGYALGARSLGILKNSLEWEYVIFVIAIVAGVIILITHFIHLDDHVKKIDELESSYLKTA